MHIADKLPYLFAQYICSYPGLDTGSLKVIFKHKTLSFSGLFGHKIKKSVNYYADLNILQNLNNWNGLSDLLKMDMSKSA